ALGLFWHDHTLRQVLATRCERERASFIDGCEQSEPLDWRAICVEHARSPSGRERCVAACGELLELRAVDVAADHPVRAATLRVAGASPSRCRDEKLQAGQHLILALAA